MKEVWHHETQVSKNLWVADIIEHKMTTHFILYKKRKEKKLFSGNHLHLIDMMHHIARVILKFVGPKKLFSDLIDSKRLIT